MDNAQRAATATQEIYCRSDDSGGVGILCDRKQEERGQSKPNQSLSSLSSLSLLSLSLSLSLSRTVVNMLLLSSTARESSAH